MKSALFSRKSKMAFAAVLGLSLYFGGALDTVSAAPPAPPVSAPSWDRTFAPYEDVTVTKVSFIDRLGIRIAADLYVPKDLDLTRKHEAIIVGTPFGAVKEQAGGFYANEMAHRGFITLAFDPAYNGESGGQPRQTISPETLVEDFSAAVDYLGTRSFVDRNRIGVIGVCGSGGFSVSAAAIDPRIKALATVSMYDMGRATRQGLHDTVTEEQKKANLKAIGELRWQEYETGERHIRFGTPETMDAAVDRSASVAAEFFDYYRTARGYHPRYMGTRVTSNGALMNFFPFTQIGDISPRPLLFIAGERAHSRYFSEDAYRLAKEPKELYIVPGANHVDLYDQKDKIPFDKLVSFFQTNL